MFWNIVLHYDKHNIEIKPSYQTIRGIKTEKVYQFLYCSSNDHTSKENPRQINNISKLS